jgi:hypothetical protein
MRGYKIFILSKKDNRKKYTLEFCFSDKTDYDLIFKSEKYNNNINSLFKENDLLNVFSNFEKIAIGIKNEIFDEKIIKEYYGKYFFIYYQYFIFNLKEMNNNNYKNVFYFIEYEKIIKKWNINNSFDNGVF